jgi:hypothetical protein
MGDYSPEPPRKDLVFHHTFDNVEQDRVVDVSPQSNDGKIVGEVTLGHAGTVGSAARLASRDANVEVSGAADYFPLNSLAIGSWVRSDEPIPASDTKVSAAITVGGTTTTLSHSANEDVSAWQFGYLTYDGTTARLWYGLRGGTPRVVESVRLGGEASEASIQFETRRWGYVDDTRLYRTSLGEDEVRALFEIGAEHNSLLRLKQTWPSDALAFQGENRALAGTLAESIDKNFRQLDAVREARHIGDAAGSQLERIGRLVGVRRREDESDAKYRARVQGTAAAGRSSGTFDDLLSATATILDVSENRVELRTDFAANPATAFVYVRTADLEASLLTTSDLKEVLEDAVLAGHAVEVVEQGANPFTVINDTQTNDPDRGLTSDSISTGGGLTSDA